jgi:hypothetical protein
MKQVLYSVKCYVIRVFNYSSSWESWDDGGGTASNLDAMTERYGDACQQA